MYSDGDQQAVHNQIAIQNSASLVLIMTCFILSFDTERGQKSKQIQKGGKAEKRGVENCRVGFLPLLLLQYDFRFRIVSLNFSFVAV